MSLASWDPLIVAVAPNGARLTQADHPAIPIAPDELAHTAAECVEAGAAMIHLHVRDKDLRHTLDADAYKAAIAAVRREVGERIVVQVTSEAVGIYKPDEQMAMVRAVRPEAVSLAVREIVPDEASEKTAAEFLGWVAKERICPQYILYSDDDVRRFADLRARGVVPGARPFVLHVLGRYTKGQVSAPTDLLPFLAAQGDASVHWGMCAFGARENACAVASAALGGHVRVGFENNRLLPDGRTAPTNAASVALVADASCAMGRPTADADAARELLSSGN